MKKEVKEDLEDDRRRRRRQNLFHPDPGQVLHSSREECKKENEV